MYLKDVTVKNDISIPNFYSKKLIVETHQIDLEAYVIQPLSLKYNIMIDKVVRVVLKVLYLDLRKELRLHEDFLFIFV